MASRLAVRAADYNEREGGREGRRVRGGVGASREVFGNEALYLLKFDRYVRPIL